MVTIHREAECDDREPLGASQRHLPHLTYHNVEKAITWLSSAFGFSEHYRATANRPTVHRCIRAFRILEELHETAYGGMGY